MIVILPIGAQAVKVVSDYGQWEFGVEWRRGRGRSFNGYRRYALRRPWHHADAQRACWEGWPSGAPDPANVDEQRTVYQYADGNKRFRRWLEAKISQLAASGV